MKKLESALKFIRLLDEQDGHLSLTNVTLMICLGKLLMTPSLSIMEIGALCVSLATYHGKRYYQAKNGQSEPTEIEAQVAELKSKVNSLTIGMGFKNGKN